MADLREKIDNFFTVAKKGYDSTYWIFVIVASAAVITKLFGVSGIVASVLAFFCFYIFGRISLRREKRIAKRKAKG